ncbi:SDR family oxidoreductase [Actinocorallia sp. A-T 12471]|uniref:SDR family oxidoreductase n=1 Tax=Actinocorallia sp. A-T 12471 TaxID=3089813 RepID=UPI0029D00775|nr:SDR family oxidoreductase [Actinocorallia sp. A-T 12471]MDX6740227.1 SDR family oxidoreductase [Actinocorallia sp. A-T 12471]
MRVFVTGANGLIGSAVVPELITAGHEVVGLARSDTSAQTVAEMGADVLRGDLDDADALRAGAADADAVIHLAFGHDFTKFAEATAQEAAVIETFAAVLRGTGKALVTASGTPAIPGRTSTEDDPAPTEGPNGGRGRNAKTVLDLAADGVRSAVVRLPRSVHERGEGYGFSSILIDAARRTGVSGYVGDGSQRWPAVHRRDAARLFRLVLEDAAPGTVAHAVADEGDPMRALAEAIGHQLNTPVKPVAAEDFGFLGSVFALDQPSSSARTRAAFGWEPTHPSLLTDLNSGDYPA